MTITALQGGGCLTVTHAGTGESHHGTLAAGYRASRVSMADSE